MIHSYSFDEPLKGWDKLKNLTVDCGFMDSRCAAGVFE